MQVHLLGRCKLRRSRSAVAHQVSFVSEMELPRMQEAINGIKWQF